MFIFPIKTPSKTKTGDSKLLRLYLIEFYIVVKRLNAIFGNQLTKFRWHYNVIGLYLTLFISCIAMIIYQSRRLTFTY